LSSPDAASKGTAGRRFLGRLFSIGSVPAATLVCVAGLNFVFFLAFARALGLAEFTVFATAAAIVMFAMSIAEAGSIFVAPPIVGPFSGRKSARFAAGFIAVSGILLALSASLGALIWVLFSDAPLSVAWLARYALLLAPNLVLQNWVVMRFHRPFATLGAVTLTRAMPLVALFTPLSFDLLLAVSLAGVALIITRDTRAAHSLARPRLTDLALCAQLLRRVFALRLMASTVTSCAPLLLGLLASPAAVAAYLLGDRLKVLVASAYQPFVQGLYLVRCRQSSTHLDRWLIVAVCLVLSALLLSGAISAWFAPWINEVLYGAKYPQGGTLALFTIAGHLSVVSSLGYFLVLIPSGRTGQFIKAVTGQVIVFVVSLVLLTRWDAVQGPAFAILAAEGFLLLAIGTSVAFMALRPAQHRPA
jgi:O-antigen/teichoic acid export membrane protein